MAFDQFRDRRDNSFTVDESDTEDLNQSTQSHDSTLIRVTMATHTTATGTRPSVTLSANGTASTSNPQQLPRGNVQDNTYRPNGQQGGVNPNGAQRVPSPEQQQQALQQQQQALQQQQAADKQAKVGVGQINKIIPSLRTRDLDSIKKQIDLRQQQLNAKKPNVGTPPTGVQTATGTQPTAGQPNLQVQQGGLSNQQAVAESTEFYSKFLGKNI